MPHTTEDPFAVVRRAEGGELFAVDGQQLGDSLASSWVAMPAFFLGWVAVGVAVGIGLGLRGHDQRTMVALGAGPGGGLDVVVLVQDQPDHIRSVVPTLDAVRDDIGTLTLVRAVPYERTEAGLDSEFVNRVRDALVAARDLSPIVGAALVVYPGSVRQLRRTFATRPRTTLVLIALEEHAAGQGQR